MMEINMDFNRELTLGELEEPKYGLSSTLTFIYSMETKMVYGLNAACRTRDPSKIETFGPFATAMVPIVFGTEANRFKEKDRLLQEDFNHLYRGFTLPPAAI